MESGAAVFAMTYSDMQTAADKCEELEEGYTQCSQFLYGACSWPTAGHLGGGVLGTEGRLQWAVTQESPWAPGRSSAGPLQAGSDPCPTGARTLSLFPVPSGVKGRV